MSRILPAHPASRVLAALAATLVAGVVLGGRHPLPGEALLGLIAAGLLLLAIALHRRWRTAALAAGLVVLGCAGLLRGASAVPARPLPAAGATIIRGAVRDSPVPHGGESVVVVDVAQLAPPSAGVSAVALAVPGRSDLLPGDRVEVQASGLRAPGGRPGPLSAAVLDRGGVDAVVVSPRVTVLARGAMSPLRAVATVRAGITSTLGARLDEPQATLVGAVAFGIRGRLPAALDADLRDSGLQHLVATSGLKVAIVATLFARLAGLLVLGPRSRVAATGAVLASYVVVAGGGAAATRSALMAGVTLALSGSGRRAEPLPLLGLVAGLLLLVDPRLAGDAGFQLSFLGTLGIVALATPLAARIPGPRLLVEPFAVTVAAQVATAPVMATTFGTLSPIGPVANALAVPLVAPLLALATLGVALAAVVPWLGWPALQGASCLASAIALVAHVAARVPGGAIHLAEWPFAWTVLEAVVVATVVLFALWRGDAGGAPGEPGHPPPGSTSPRQSADWRRLLLRVARGRSASAPASSPDSAPPGRLALCAVGAVIGLPVVGLLAAGAAQPDGRLHVAVMPAGSGPAVLVRTSSGGLALVDAGYDPQQLLTSLAGALPLFTHTIDELVLTGGERAAIAGLADLAAHYRLAHVVVPDGDLGTAARTAVLALRQGGSAVDVVPTGASWQWSGAAWRCIPSGPQDGTTAVEPLCALQVRDGDAGALLLGDMAPPAQEEVVAAAGDGLRTDLVVAPPSGLVAPSLLSASGARLIAVPGTRVPRAALAASYPGVALRSTGVDGTLEYATGAWGALEQT